MTTHATLCEFGLKIEGPVDGDFDELIARAMEASQAAVEGILRGTDLTVRWRSYAPPWVYERPEE